MPAGTYDGLYATTNTTIDAYCQAGETGLVGTIGYRIVDSEGDPIAPRTTDAITEIVAGSGLYKARITTPATAGDYRIVWDTGGDTPLYAEEALSIPGGASGLAADPWAAELPASYPQGTAGHAIGRLGTASINAISPVTTRGHIRTIQGDDYYNADGRALVWINPDGNWPDLEGAEVILVTSVYVYADDEEEEEEGDYLSFPAEVITPSGVNQQIKAELTAEDTASLPANVMEYRLTATLVNEHQHTLAEGTWENA